MKVCKKISIISLILILSLTISLNTAKAAIGDGKPFIKITPFLSTPAIGNGNELKIYTSIQSNFPITGGKAVISDVNVEIPFTRTSGDSKNGFWTAQWITHSLGQKNYSVQVTFNDETGHSWTDRSLSFSDPIAGNDNKGNDKYKPNLIEKKVVGNKIYLPIGAKNVNSIKFYAHNNQGIVEVGLYNRKKELIWQSFKINKFKKGWVEVKINQGYPRQIKNLPIGEYLIAIRSISNHNLIGHSNDKIFNGFEYKNTADRMPYKLDSFINTSSNWSIHIVYDENKKKTKNNTILLDQIDQKIFYTYFQ